MSRLLTPKNKPVPRRKVTKEPVRCRVPYCDEVLKKGKVFCNTHWGRVSRKRQYELLETYAIGEPRGGVKFQGALIVLTEEIIQSEKHIPKSMLKETK